MAKLYLNLPARLLCTTCVLVYVQTCYAVRCWDRRTIRVRSEVQSLYYYCSTVKCKHTVRYEIGGQLQEVQCWDCVHVACTAEPMSMYTHAQISRKHMIVLLDLAFWSLCVTEKYTEKLLSERRKLSLKEKKVAHCHTLTHIPGRV